MPQTKLHMLENIVQVLVQGPYTKLLALYEKG